MPNSNRRPDSILFNALFTKIDGQAMRKAAGLCALPVEGNFDATHLKKIHGRIFLEAKSSPLVAHVKPGEFREEVSQWLKFRRIDNAEYLVGYSLMTPRDIAEINDVLAKVNISKFRTLSQDNFSAEIAQIYAGLDYIHPFREGNSRTIRAFLQQVAFESGYLLDWRVCDDLENREHADALHSAFYIARDLAVNKRSIEIYRGTKYEALQIKYLETFQDNPRLPDVFKTIILHAEQLPALYKGDNSRTTLAVCTQSNPGYEHEEGVSGITSTQMEPLSERIQSLEN